MDSFLESVVQTRMPLNPHPFHRRRRRLLHLFKLIQKKSWVTTKTSRVTKSLCRPKSLLCRPMRYLLWHKVSLRHPMLNVQSLRRSKLLLRQCQRPLKQRRKQQQLLLPHDLKRHKLKLPSLTRANQLLLQLTCQWRSRLLLSMSSNFLQLLQNPLL